MVKIYIIFPNYNNEKYLYSTYDLILGFKYTNLDKKSYYDFHYGQHIINFMILKQIIIY